jgi:hypothetical protein
VRHKRVRGTGRYQTLSAVIRPSGPAPRALRANRSRRDFNPGAKLPLIVRINEHDLDHEWGTCWDHERFESFQPAGQISANHPSASSALFSCGPI